MRLYFHHGLKIAFANLFGSLLTSFLSLMGLFIFGVTILLLTIGTSIVELFHGNFNFREIMSVFSFEQSPIWAILCCFLLFFYLLYQIFVHSMVIGGLYGSSIHAVFETDKTIRAYFSYSFRNLGRLTQLQWLLILLSIPLLIVTVILIILLDTLIDSPNVIFFQISFSVLLCSVFFTLFLHSPIFIIKNRLTVWQSIQISLQLLKRGLYPTLFSSFAFFAILVLFNGTFFGLWWYIFSLTNSSISSLQFSFESLEAILILIIGFLIWCSSVFPYSMICALLILVKRYKSHLHHLATILSEKTNQKEIRSQTENG